MKLGTHGFRIFKRQTGRYKTMVTVYLLLIVYGFLLTFLPEDVATKLMGSNFANGWLFSSANAMTSGALSFIIRIPLFGGDRLATGNSKASKYFRSMYPSLLIRQKYNVESGQADDLWFTIFNSWSIETHRHHQNWETVLKRTYICRLIFYSSRLLIFAVVISGSILAAKGIIALFKGVSPIISGGGLAYFLLMLIALLLTLPLNRVPSGSRQAPTGCWYKYKEISEILHSVLRREVLDKADRFDDAMVIASDNRSLEISS